MARLFDEPTSQGFYLDSALISSMPLSVLLSFNVTSLAPAFQFAMCLGRSSANTGRYGISINSDGTIRAQQQQNGGGSSGNAIASASVVPGKWHRVGASFVSTTSRAIFLDGVKDSDTTSVSAPTVNRTSIAYRKANTDDLFYGGLIQDVAFFNVTLTDAEFAAHAAGENIRNIRPTALVAHWTFRDRATIDTRGQNALISRTQPEPIWVPVPRTTFPRRRRPILRLIMPPDVAAGTSVALSGNAGTGAVGSLGKAVSLAISGNAGTGSVGSFGLAVSTALSGEVGTGAIGSLGLAISVALSGNSATGSVGTLALSSPALAGNAATGSVGSLGLAVGTSLAGEAATGAVGSVGVAAAVTLSGNVGTGAVGSFGLAAAISITGNAGTGAVGSLGLTGGVALTGNAGTGSVGSVGLTVAVALSGNAGTGSVGSLSLTGGNLSVTWTGEDDWRSARAESGVIHRNFGDRVSTEIAMGTDLLPQAMVDWFGQGTSQPLVGIMPETAVYDSTANKTFIVWQGPRLKPYITYYDHTLSAWGDIVRISTTSLTDDDHGAPQICQDASGYLHVFWGTHNNAANYSISTSARDISAWTAQTAVTGNWTYQQPFVIAGNIWLIGRVQVGATSTYTLSAKQSNGVATGHTWNSLIDLCSFSAKLAYSSDCVVSGNNIHIVWWRREGIGGASKNVYYAVYETDTGNLKTAADTTHGALPISEATADANYRAFNSGANQSNAPTLWLDSSGYPHIAFIYDNATTVDLMHTRWNGSAWTTAVSLATGAALWNNPAPIVASDTAADLYWRTSAGNTNKTSFNPSDDSGISTAAWLTIGDWGPNGVLDYLNPIAITNAHADMRLINAENNNDVWAYEHVRVGAWGDSGWVKAPAYRHDALIALPFNEDSGAGTLVDYSGHKQDATNVSVVMGSTGLLGLTGAGFASTREAYIPHNTGQWLFGIPCVVRWWGNSMTGPIIAKGQPYNSDLRYCVAISTDSLKVFNKVDGTWLTAESNTGLTFTGAHLYEVSYDGAGTITFRMDGADIGTSTAISNAKFTAKSPTNALYIGYWYNSAVSSSSKAYATGVGQGLIVLPRYQSTLADHQAFWDTLTAGSFTSKWVEAA